MKILVAEDDQISSTFYKKMLTKWGFTCDLVSNGREAVSRAIENDGKYDICLMDIDMPFMNGYEAAKLIRRKTKYFPILAVTGNSAIKDRYSECGMDDYLKKPWNISDLREKIAELTIKTTKLYIKKDKIIIIKEMPMDAKHLQELRELDKKGLTKLTFMGSGHEFVVHKNVQNKISYDFIDQGQDISEFVDRSEDKPGLCHLYKVNLLVNTKSLLPEELEERLKKEDEILKKHKEAVVKKSE